MTTPGLTAGTALRRLAAVLPLAAAVAGAGAITACAPGGPDSRIPGSAAPSSPAPDAPAAADPGAPPGTAASPTTAHAGFRIRSDFDAPLNAPSGWAGALNEDVTVRADEPFRIRFEVETTGAPGAEHRFRLQARRNDGPWQDLVARDFPYPDEISTPRVSIVATDAYATGAATRDVVDASTLPFGGGAGVSLDSITSAWSPETRGHSEWEWPVVIRRWADGAVTSETGDVFELRMTDATGRPLGAGPTPRLALEVPARLLGGTFVETPGRIGPWQTADGSLYFVMEPAETYNVLMVVRSTDGGSGWAEVDGANRPATDDLEGFATDLHDGRIHMLHQTSDAVWYHAFGTADDPKGPNRWVVRDERIATPGEPPVQVATLVARSDGSLVAVYGDSATLAYRVRSPAGEWAPERRIEAEPGTTLSGPQATLGQGDEVHVAYTATGPGGGSVRLRTIGRDGALSPEIRVADGIGTREADYGSVAPLVFLPRTGATVILYRTANAFLHARRLEPRGERHGQVRLTDPVRVTDRRVAQNAVDSDQVGADAIGYQDEVHVLFIDEATGAIHYVRSPAPGEWSATRPVVEDVAGQWVRGTLIRTERGEPAYGFVYDAGSDGGSGMNRYGEVPVAPATTAGPGS